jgi:hypothetical protein
MDPQPLAEALHHIRDVPYGEDASQVRVGRIQPGVTKADVIRLCRGRHCKTSGGL